MALCHQSLKKNFFTHFKGTLSPDLQKTFYVVAWFLWLWVKVIEIMHLTGQSYLKRSLTWDFQLQVFFTNNCPLGKQWQIIDSWGMNTSLRLCYFDSWGTNTSLCLCSFDSWGTNTLVCLRSFDSLGTNKFVILRPFDSWGTNIFVLHVMEPRNRFQGTNSASQCSLSPYL